MTDGRAIYIVNGVTAFLFSSTGPVAIIIAVASTMGLSDLHVASWLFAGFAVAGAVTLGFSIYYRMPIVFAWSIPGTVLLFSALDHLAFSDVVGAYLGTAFVILLVGISGFATRILAWIPKPVVMAMVAGIFLDFGLKLVGAFTDAPLMAALMVITFVLVSASGKMQRLFPPILAALLVGAVVVVSKGSLQDSGSLSGIFTTPVVFTPTFSLQAMLELVVPLAITVLMVQNAQGFAVLGSAGHRPPYHAMTNACGLGSILFAMLGAVPMCVTGPSNAILSGSGAREKQYIGGITYGVLAIVFGICSGLMAWLAFKLPPAYIAVLGGLAVFKVLERAFVAAFSGGYTLGALTTLLVTVSNINLLSIGAPFWGLVFGTVVSALLERNQGG